MKADGTDQLVKASDDFEHLTVGRFAGNLLTISVKPLEDHSVQFTYKKNGKVVSEYTETVSPDGKVLTEQGKTFPPKGGPVTWKTTRLRVKEAPAGANPISGAWRVNQVEQVSENGLIVRYKGSQDGLAMAWQTGESYVAKFDGKEYPIKVEPGATVSLRKVSVRKIEETVKQHGKVVRVYKITVAPDGNTLSLPLNDKQHGMTWLMSAQKQ